MSGRWTVTFVAAALAAAVPVANLPCAWAGAPAPQSVRPINKKKQAKEYTDAGVAAHDAGDYDTALSFYAKAYELVPHPTLLFNMAQSQRLAGRLPEAVNLYKRYLAEQPKGPQAKTARELVTSLEVQIAADEARKAKEAADAEAAAKAKQAEEARQAEETRKAEEDEAKAEKMHEATEALKAEDAKEAARKAAAVAPTVPPAPPPAPEVDTGAPGRPLRLGGVGLAFAGVAMMFGGVAYGIEANRMSDDLKNLGRDGQTPDGRTISDRDQARQDRIVLLGLGALVVAGGGALYWMGRQRESRGVAIAPAWSQGPGLVVGGGF